MARSLSTLLNVRASQSRARHQAETGNREQLTRTRQHGSRNATVIHAGAGLQTRIEDSHTDQGSSDNRTTFNHFRPG